MHFSDKHKALLITFLITGTIIFSMFSFHIKQQEKHIAESFYEITPNEDIVTEELEKQTKAETNKAFNENQKSQRFAQAYKKIAPPEEYVRPSYNTASNNASSNEENKAKAPFLNKEERNSFSKVNNVLKKQLEEDANNTKSTVSYSLVNRKHRYLPTPIYLCETGGKVVISITVNAKGKVTTVSYNNASSTANQCIIKHALEYAKKARFNSDVSKDSQIGSITFYFEGKH